MSHSVRQHQAPPTAAGDNAGRAAGATSGGVGTSGSMESPLASVMWAPAATRAHPVLGSDVGNSASARPEPSSRSGSAAEYGEDDFDATFFAAVAAAGGETPQGLSHSSEGLSSAEHGGPWFRAAAPLYASPAAQRQATAPPGFGVATNEAESQFRSESAHLPARRTHGDPARSRTTVGLTVRPKSEEARLWLDEDGLWGVGGSASLSSGRAGSADGDRSQPNGRSHMHGTDFRAESLPPSQRDAVGGPSLVAGVPPRARSADALYDSSAFASHSGEKERARAGVAMLRGPGDHVAVDRRLAYAAAPAGYQDHRRMLPPAAAAQRHGHRPAEATFRVADAPQASQALQYVPASVMASQPTAAHSHATAYGGQYQQASYPVTQVRMSDGSVQYLSAPSQAYVVSHQVYHAGGHVVTPGQASYVAAPQGPPRVQSYVQPLGSHYAPTYTQVQGGGGAVLLATAPVAGAPVPVVPYVVDGHYQHASPGVAATGNNAHITYYADGTSAVTHSAYGYVGRVYLRAFWPTLTCDVLLQCRGSRPLRRGAWSGRCSKQLGLRQARARAKPRCSSRPACANAHCAPGSGRESAGQIGCCRPGELHPGFGRQRTGWAGRGTCAGSAQFSHSTGRT